MNFRNTLLLGIVLFMAAFARGDEGNKQTEADDHDKNVIPQSTAHPRMSVGDLTLPSGLASLITNGGLLAGAVLAVGAVAALLAPLFGLKLCTLFGNCDSNGYQAYSSGPAYNDYSGYQQGTYNNPVYQKRSLEYIGPILKALGNAYEKYSRQVATTATATAKSV